MNKQNSQNGQQQSFVPCPLCEDTKKKGWAVCAKCHDLFVKEATSLVLKEQDAPSKEDWLIQRLQLALPGLEETLQKTEEELEGAKKIKDIYLNKLIADKIAGRSLHPDVVAEVRKRLIKEQDDSAWKAAGGPTAFWKTKVAGARLQEAKRLLKELTQKKVNGVASTAAQTPTMEVHETQDVTEQ